MAVIETSERLQIIAFDVEGHRAAFARDVRVGLTAVPKWLPCCYFYDAEGSRLFEEICSLPEYYLTRTERDILAQRAAEIAGRFPEPIALVELGSGSAAKTRLLIEAFLQRHRCLRYVPVDISPSILEDSSLALLDEYPRLEIVAVAAEYADGLAHLRAVTDHPKLILWLGSNVGNLDRPKAAAFLRQVRRTMTERDRLLIGIDLRKACTILERAYDDSLGITARFNLNLLARINQELGGNFDLAAFRHRAIYNEDLGRVEMHLESLHSQRVRIQALETEVRFAAGETIHTENSYKYSPDEIETMCGGAGYQLEQQWLDDESRFSVNLLAPGITPGD
jgi:L-histidine Nalpha-methyltransferase